MLYHCSKMMVAETSLVKKNHQIPRIINQKIAQKLIEKTSMTDIAHQLAISTSTVIRKLNDFRFSMIFLVFLKLYPGMSTLLQRERLVSLRKILKSSISLLFLKGEHKLSSGITFCATIEPFVLR